LQQQTAAAEDRPGACIQRLIYIYIKRLIYIYIKRLIYIYRKRLIYIYLQTCIDTKETWSVLLEQQRVGAVE